MNIRILFLISFILLFLQQVRGQNAVGLYRSGLEISVSKPDSAKVLFEKAVEASRNEKNDTLLAHALHEYGKTCYETAKYSLAADAFAEAEQLYEKSGRKYELAELDLTRGKLYLKLSDFDLAGKHIVSAQKRFAALHNLTGQLKAENSLGVLYYEKGDLTRAKAVFLELQKKTPDGDASQIDLFGNLAIMYFYDNIPDSALHYFHLSLQENLVANNTDGIAVSYNNMGHALVMKKDYDSAMACFNRSLELYRSVENHAGVCLVLGSKAQVHHRKKEYDKALRLYLQSLDISIPLGLKYFAENTSLRVAQLEESRGNYKEAYKYLKLHLNYRDSTQSEKSDRLIEEMQARFNMEKKEAQIDSLKQQQVLSDLQLIAQEKEAQKKSYLVRGMLIISILVLVLGGVMFNAYRSKQKTNRLLTLKNLEVAQQNKEIKDSIKYAKHIQEAILPPAELIERLFPASFVLYKPKDIVSGDFYWVEESDDTILFAAVDCTGHGVPGAFMSIVAYNGLLQAVNVNKLKKPSEILNFLTVHVNTVLRQNSENSTIRDGMDIALCAVNKSFTKLEFSGANNPLIIARKGLEELIEIAPDKQPVGTFSGIETRPFTHHEIELKEGDSIFIFSDGYADQFGGEKGKKLKNSQFKQLLRSLAVDSPKKQHEQLLRHFESWKGDLEQLDDVCVMGIRV